MLTFFNDEKIKAKYLERVNGHIAAGNLTRKLGWKDGKGGAVGCTLECYKPELYEIELGIPESLARIEEAIFNYMSSEKSKTWPRDFLEAIPVGVDVSRVKWKFCCYLMNRNIESVSLLNLEDNLKKQIVDAIKQVLSLHIKATETGKWEVLPARSEETKAWAIGRESGCEAAKFASWSAAVSAQGAFEIAIESSAIAEIKSASPSNESELKSAIYDNYADEFLRLLKNEGI